MKAFCDGWLVGKRTSKVTSKSSNRAAGQQKQQGKSSSAGRVAVEQPVEVAGEAARVDQGPC